MHLQSLLALALVTLSATTVVSAETSTYERGALGRSYDAESGLQAIRGLAMDEDELFSRDNESPFLRGLTDDEVEEMALRDIAEEEALEMRASSNRPDYSPFAGLPASWRIKQPQPELGPVNCRAVTKYLHTYHKNRESYKRWKARLVEAKELKNTKAIDLAESRLSEKKEYSKRLLWALLMQGRAKHER